MCRPLNLMRVQCSTVYNINSLLARSKVLLAAVSACEVQRVMRRAFMLLWPPGFNRHPFTCL